MSDATPQFEILIIGSGPSGCHAAIEVAASGYKVGLLDVGHTENPSQQSVPFLPFSQARRSDPYQHRYFLGDDPKEVLRSQERAGAHLTPARLHMIRDMDALFPIQSDTFLPLQSTGLGGLGISWGANCFAFEDFELDRIGISPAEIRSYYADVADEIGISGPVNDALTPFIANMDHARVQPPLPLDSNAESIFRRYRSRERRYIERGFYMGQSLLAMLSRPKDNREANPEFDMDFWADLGRSVYRPKFTLEKLKALPNFTHLTGRLATRFREDPRGVTVSCRRLAGNIPEAFTARKLLLAAGAINTGRLTLASFDDYDSKLPVLCNVNHWAAAINLSMLGRPARDRRHSLSQLTVLMRTMENPDYVLAQLYSYRSLLLFRLLRNVPLRLRQSLLFLRLIVTALTCINIHFADYPSPERWLKLGGEDGENTLMAGCAFNPSEENRIRSSEQRLLHFLMRLGCIPVGMTRPTHGASLHYAGTLPYSEEKRPYTTCLDGKLHGTSHVYVADGASWRFLPAKGLTLTLMANARRVAASAVRELALEPVAIASSCI